MSLHTKLINIEYSIFISQTQRWTREIAKIYLLFIYKIIANVAELPILWKFINKDNKCIYTQFT